MKHTPITLPTFADVAALATKDRPDWRARLRTALLPAFTAFEEARSKGARARSKDLPELQHVITLADALIPLVGIGLLARDETGDHNLEAAALIGEQALLRRLSDRDRPLFALAIAASLVRVEVPTCYGCNVGSGERPLYQLAWGEGLSEAIYCARCWALEVESHETAPDVVESMLAVEAERSPHPPPAAPKPRGSRRKAATT